MAELKLENVSFTYGKNTSYAKKAVDGVSLTIDSEDITGIIGHTGSGKSTVVKLLNGLLKPDSGKVYFDGVDINEDSALKSSICSKVGIVMQYPEYQLFEETVEKDVAFGPKNIGCSDEETAKRVTEAIEFVGLDDDHVEDKSPFDLSGGQKRRVAIAGVMAMKPVFLVLDEPAAGLDPSGRKEIFGGLLRYHERTGCGVVIVSHNMEDVAKYCENVIVISGGRIALSGPAEEVFSQRKTLEDMGLDVPAAFKIASELRERGIDVPGDVCRIDDLADYIASIGG